MQRSTFVETNPKYLNKKYKEPFDIERAVKILRQAIKPFKKAMLFELAEKGFISPFSQLVACLISIRTRDEVSLTIAENLFKEATTPKQILQLSTERLATLLHGSQFPYQKAVNIQTIAKEIIDKYKGELPCDEEVLLSFKGVGPKCANLVLGISGGQKKIGVDIHVHRVTNRWGFVSAPTPEKTMVKLEHVLPKKYWIEINKLLVPFGKHICTSVPHCTKCPLLSMCQQIGVERFL